MATSGFFGMLATNGRRHHGPVRRNSTFPWGAAPCAALIGPYGLMVDQAKPPTSSKPCLVRVRATDMAARTNPTGVLIVSFERAGHEVEYPICQNGERAWSGATSILANFAELQAGHQRIVSDESL